KNTPYTWKCPFPPGPPPVQPTPTPYPICPGCPPCQGCPPCANYPYCGTPIPPPCYNYPNCNIPPTPVPPPCYNWPNCNYPPPPPPPPPHVTCWYRIRYGDTLYSIAWRYGVTTWQLQQWNGISNPNLIYAGMVIKVCPF